MASLILASSSPRRRDLLAAAGFRFAVHRPAAPEIESSDFSARELTFFNATRKALEIALQEPQAVVLGADTLVSLEGEVIGKPVDLDDARRILRRLCGRTHQVHTAVFACHGTNGPRHSRGVVSQVRFHAWGEQEIERYLEKVEPLDKAGAYAAQETGSEIIAEISGSRTNVIGLPMAETTELLRALGIVAGPQSAGVRQQTSSLLPSGSSKKKA